MDVLWLLDLAGSGKPIPGGRPNLEPYALAPDLRARAEGLLDEFLAETIRRHQEDRGDPLAFPRATPNQILGALPPDGPVGKWILAAEPALRVAILRVGFDRVAAAAGGRSFTGAPWRLKPLLSQLCRRQLPFGEADVCWLIGRLVASRASWDALDEPRRNRVADGPFRDGRGV